MQEQAEEITVAGNAETGGTTGTSRLSNCTSRLAGIKVVVTVTV